MKRYTKAIICCLIVIFSVISVLKISTADTGKIFAGTMAELQEKETKVIELTGASAISSVAVAAVPGDATTPIANEIASVSAKLLIVFCAIILEKYLVSATWILLFRFIVPVVGLFAIIYLFSQRKVFADLAVKLIAVGVAFIFVIPISMKIGRSIEDNHIDNFNNAVAVLEGYKTDNRQDNTQPEESATSGGSIWSRAKEYLENITSFASQKADELKSSAGISADKIKLSIVNMIEAIAVLIVTCCVIPLADMFIMFWIIKTVFGLNLKLPEGKITKNLLSDK